MSIEALLEQHPDLRHFLYIRGFLVTSHPGISPEGFPFFGAWKHTELNGVHVWAHPLTGFHFVSDSHRTCFLLGHAYNPFTMQTDEQQLLEPLLEHYGTDDFYDHVDQLTGIFLLGIIEDSQLTFLVDPAGMQSACHGLVDGHFHLASHPQMVADLHGLQMDAFVTRLIEYKWYRRVMGGYLPAALTPFSELKRVVPNHAYVTSFTDGTTEHRRFYPIKELAEVASRSEYEDIIAEAAKILQSNMELVTRKWPEPWISLTGGIDSNTTFAAANGVYDKVRAFSYLSAPKEVPDCEAAEKIARRFGVPWRVFRIPEDTSGLDRFDEKAAIIRHNNGYVALENDNELRKRVALEADCPAEVEIKSWVSETIRAYWYKHYGRRTMPALSAKLFRNLYKIFILNRGLAHEIDQVFAEYIDEFEYAAVPRQYPPADLHFNEVTWGSWGGLNISEMKFCFDITIIYNNRRFLDLMFKVPLEKRISDQHHLDIKRYLNPELSDMGIRVVNLKETRFRAFALNVLFTINSILPGGRAWS
ncbi:hypothetical protein [Aestuariimicrobium sp. Y1814]|uniref:hypothetical protein n=1 Tax=Aestuariimicrobium sp. Y1814 TaxID=3418742 RepID=UPI003DA73081